MRSKRTSRTTRRKAEQAIAERGVHGEGSYEGTRAYNAAIRRFVGSGRVDEAARAAAPRDAAEARSIERAEQAGRARARGEDPALSRRTPKARKRTA